MYLRRRFESKITDQQKKIAELEKQLAEARAYLSGLQDSLKLLPQEGSASSSPALREGSELDKARLFLKKAGKPMHIEEILKGIGKEVNRNSKGALSGSIGSYVRKGIIFTRPGPNIFGLAEFETSVTEEPPADFGTPA